LDGRTLAIADNSRRHRIPGLEAIQKRRSLNWLWHTQEFRVSRYGSNWRFFRSLGGNFALIGSGMRWLSFRNWKFRACERRKSQAGAALRRPIKAAPDTQPFDFCEQLLRQ
jgi:hypothetical protein